MSVYNVASDVANPRRHHRLEDIPAHDPFVLTDTVTGTYYLYTGAAPKLHGVDRYGVLVYKSTDLEQWAGPTVVFSIPDDSWAHPQHGAWAPEVHEYKGRYYLLVTLHNNDRLLEGEPIQGYTRHWRGTSIAVSDTPEGPFELINRDRPVLPETMMTLDGTLYIDEQQQPWIVYCHEWVQTIDGTIEAMRLHDDWTGTVGEPMHLFSGSAAPWLWSTSSHTPNAMPDQASVDIALSDIALSSDAALPKHTASPTDTAPSSDMASHEPTVYVTDGCQLYRTSGGSLVMLWSSYEHDSYVQTIARSVSGKLEGPWEQLEPLVREDSGHGMLFQTVEGAWKLILHRPFRIPESRCYLFDVEDTGDCFRLVK
ncbi:glycoside hydrolase family 43 protein [Paenibacillus wenxiniae]|uniref:Glycoside hydrolase family 43 protein n=1 Tax=Paenibacillus wenxiniae TaxID=1636843 RepID=A0ABW4RF12_9BACL